MEHNTSYPANWATKSSGWPTGSTSFPATAAALGLTPAQVAAAVADGLGSSTSCNRGCRPYAIGHFLHQRRDRRPDRGRPRRRRRCRCSSAHPARRGGPGDTRRGCPASSTSSGSSRTAAKHRHHRRRPVHLGTAQPGPDLTDHPAGHLPPYLRQPGVHQMGLGRQHRVAGQLRNPGGPRRRQRFCAADH